MAIDPKTAVSVGYDLGYAALQSFTKGEFNITLDHPDYYFCNDVITGAEKKDGGKYFTFEVILGKTGNAAHVGYYETYTPNVRNIDKEGTVNWAKAHTSYSYDIDEVNVNSSATEVYNLLKSRRANSQVELGDLLEPRGWTAPDSASDNLNPFGVFAWLAPPGASYGTTGSEGFIGGKTYYLSASSTTAAISPGGIDPTASGNQGWNSYTANYGGGAAASVAGTAQAVTSTVIDYLGSAMRRTAFVAPLKAENVMDMKFNKLRIFTDNEVIKQLEKIARLSDDQLGYDLGKYNGLTTYKRFPLLYVSWLESTDQYGNTNPYFNAYCSGVHPIVGINFNHFKCFALKDCYFRELPPMNDVQTPNVFTIHLDLQYCYIVNNRQRAGFLVTQY
jgi:hypothetical protein